MSQKQTMNSRCFTCALLEADPEIGEPLTVLTLRRVHFPHMPVILTATETEELRALLNRWDPDPAKKVDKKDGESNP